MGIQWEYGGNTVGIQWEYDGNAMGIMNNEYPSSPAAAGYDAVK
jgi:hypothetical protein